jgi:hypothetical protein
LGVNAGRLARALVGEGWDEKLAHSLCEHLADELERTVASREHVELVVGREVQQLRVEMHEQIGGLRAEMQERFAGQRAEMQEQNGSLRAEISGLEVRTSAAIQSLRSEMHQELRALSERMDERFTTQFRWMTGMFITLMVAVVINLGTAVALSLFVR